MNFKKLSAISALLTLMLTACVNEVKAPDETEDEFSDISLQLAFVAMEDNGASGEAIGCGDSIVFVDKTVSASSTITDSAKVEIALNELFSVGTPFYGQSGLYNGLTHSSGLVVDAITIEDVRIRVDIGGEMISAGTCDDPRIKEQIISTIEANSEFTVSDEDVFINGESLRDHFDMRG